MIFIYSFFSFLFLIFSPFKDIKEVHHEFGKIERFLAPPPESLSLKDTSFLKYELVRIEIDRKYNITSITTSDASSVWFKREINRMYENKIFEKTQLASAVKRNKFKNCVILFPVVIKVVSYYERTNPSVKINSQSNFLPESYFKFGGECLKGNLYFGDPIYFSF